MILADGVEGTMVTVLPGHRSQGEWPPEPQAGGAEKDTASSWELNHQTKLTTWTPLKPLCPADPGRQGSEGTAGGDVVTGSSL